MSKHSHDYTPLNANSFAAEFNDAGSSIVHADRFAEHARMILVDEQNYLGLFALDLVLSNKIGQFRNDEVTPKANHPLLVFYQFQIFHENDKANPNRKWKYLPDRPDLDKVLALIHDEGEDHVGHKPSDMQTKMEDFIASIEQYVDQHNKNYPHMPLPHATPNQIDQMRKDIPAILKSFDLLSRKYKGHSEKSDYYSNHQDILEDARASRVKAVDKGCNAATFSYRNSKLTTLVPIGLDVVKYRDWVINQINKLRDLYFVQPFGLKNAFSGYDTENLQPGFLNAAKQKHPESKKFFSVMSGILKTQLDIYANNIANERLGHGSPLLRRRVEKYDAMALSSSVNLIDILVNRLSEVRRIDASKEFRDPKKGIFDIPFAPK